MVRLSLHVHNHGKVPRAEIMDLERDLIRNDPTAHDKAFKLIEGPTRPSIEIPVEVLLEMVRTLALVNPLVQRMTRFLSRFLLE